MSGQRAWAIARGGLRRLDQGGLARPVAATLLGAEAGLVIGQDRHVVLRRISPEIGEGRLPVVEPVQGDDDRARARGRQPADLGGPERAAERPAGGKPGTGGQQENERGNREDASTHGSQSTRTLSCKDGCTGGCMASPTRRQISSGVRWQSRKWRKVTARLRLARR